tara:strand:+ start:1292 stop:2011 length:720 start_codon:yes stop_codon:yes gene_type:complete
MRYYLPLLCLLFFNQTFSQDVQQVEIIKNDKQVEKLIDELGDSEMKLDVIDVLSQPALNIGYEKINDSYSSYGADIFFNFNENNASSSLSEKFSLNPYYRFYFLNKTDFGGEGYFAEVFIKFSNVHYNIDTINYSWVDVDEDGDGIIDDGYGYFDADYDTSNKKSWDIAPGVGVGRKWVNKKGWTFEYMVGVGRYLFADNEIDNNTYYYDNSEVSEYTIVNESRPVATFKGGISIGKRF